MGNITSTASVHLGWPASARPTPVTAPAVPTLPPAPDLSSDSPLSAMLAESWVVTSVEGRLEVLTDRDDLALVTQQATEVLTDPPLSVRRVSRTVMQTALLRSHGAALAEEMSHGFSRRFPALAVRSGPARWQRAALCALAGLAVMAVAFGQVEIVVAVATAFVAAASALNLLAIRRAARLRPRVDPPVPDADLPTYTVIVPAYREAAVIGDLVRAIERIDYPPHLLDVVILVEHHDPDTARAARRAGLPSHVRLVHIPPGAPQTKPRTCNLGLLLAGGELVVVFDAEDRPEPDQLRKAAARFAAGGTDLACVQAKLLFANGSENLLTRCSQLEYLTRYDLIMPGLVDLNLPIPLGGTSNHFRTETLRAVGGWDAWNVTEDADLGLRLAGLGLRTEMIDSVTWEEAVPELGAWIRQRTRWFKGFLLTAGVHSRTPLSAVRQHGVRGLVTLVGILLGNVAIAASNVLMLLPPLYLAGVLPAHHRALTAMAWCTALAGMAIGMIVHVTAVRRRGLQVPWAAVLATPVYGLAQNWAALRAMHHAIVRPFEWEKTPHRSRA